MTKKILIAEDEKSLSDALSSKLKKSGFETHVVHNGDDALAALNDGIYDLMLIDIMMPKRDGLGVLEELKKKGDKTPAFIISNSGQDQHIKYAKALGAQEYIVKSNTSLAEIVQRISIFLK
jgi:DNA-binding response OmpR family regulator